MFQLSLAAGSSVTLSLMSIDDPNVAGYKIYYGTTSRQYTQAINAGKSTTVNVPLSAYGATYYFAVTTYDSLGNESAFSEETTYVAPPFATLATAPAAAGQFGLTVTGENGVACVIQASTDLIHWQPVQTNTMPFTFVDAAAAQKPQCFYRATSL